MQSSILHDVADRHLRDLVRMPKDCLACISKEFSGDGESDGSEDAHYHNGARDCSDGRQLYPDILQERNLLGSPSKWWMKQQKEWARPKVS